MFVFDAISHSVIISDGGMLSDGVLMYLCITHQTTHKNTTNSYSMKLI